MSAAIRRPNPGYRPDDAAGKRVHVWFADGAQGRADDNVMSPPGWAADTTNWAIAGRPFEIAEYQVIG